MPPGRQTFVSKLNADQKTWMSRILWASALLLYLVLMEQLISATRRGDATSRNVFEKEEPIPIVRQPALPPEPGQPSSLEMIPKMPEPFQKPKPPAPPPQPAEPEPEPEPAPKPSSDERPDWAKPVDDPAPKAKPVLPKPVFNPRKELPSTGASDKTTAASLAIPVPAKAEPAPKEAPAAGAADASKKPHMKRAREFRDVMGTTTVR